MTKGDNRHLTKCIQEDSLASKLYTNTIWQHLPTHSKAWWQIYPITTYTDSLHTNTTTIPSKKFLINDSLTVYNSANLNYNASFGQPKDLVKSIHQKVDPPLWANTHIPISQGPHAAPKLIPAIGAAERLQATKETHKLQMEAPPGKALHFVDITEDEVGPAGIKVDLTKWFTREHLSSYHPAAAALDETTQNEIIEAHNRFSSQIHKHKEKHSKAQSQTLKSLPDQLHQKQDSTTSPLMSLRCWLHYLTTIIENILASRIIPTKLKTCHRILIDKPGKTNKRPISILHAIDEII